MWDMIDTWNSWGKFDATSMTGFILFWEISAIMLDYFSMVNLYIDFSVKSDKYSEKYFFIQCAVEIFHNCVSGNFVNYQVCEFYNDTTFIDLAKLIFSLLWVGEFNEIKSF